MTTEKKPVADNQRLTAGLIAVWAEKYIFPVLFCGSIADHLIFLYENLNKLPKVMAIMEKDPFNIQVSIFFSAYVAKILLIILNALIIAGYLMRRNLIRPPEGWREILVPALGSFFNLFYSYVQYVPEQFNPLLIPPKYSLISTFIGILLNVIGVTISAIATYHLRYSYSLFVQVRDIITHGLYKYVRHPIYCGYFISTIGFAFILPKLAYLIVFVSSIVITIYRARLEEKKLIASSPVYRDYAQKTPFILPFKFKKFIS